jgi:hypothetical protein
MALRLATVTALASLALARAAAGQNLLVNPDFDVVLQVDGWTENKVWSALDWEQDPASGSVLNQNVAAIAGNSSLVRQCVPVTEGQPYRVEARIAVQPGQEAGFARLSVSWRDLADCYDPGVSFLGFSSTLEAPVTGDFELVGDTFTAPPQSAAADLQLVVYKSADGGTLAARFDAVYLPEPGRMAQCGIAAAALADVSRRRRRRPS